MDVRGYARITERTDQLEPKSASHPNYKIMPILGLAGEIGCIPPPQAALFGERFPTKHVALRLALRSVDAGRSSGRG
jgi:hypothetical protein